MEQKQIPPGSSPKWDSTTKMIVGLTIVALVAAALFYFRVLVGPLILAFILAFLLHPIVSWSCTKIGLSWRASVNLIYLLLIVVLVSVFTITGLAILQQAQSLINFVERFVSDLPSMVEELSTRAYSIGPFQLDFSQLDLDALASQLLNVVQPLIGQAGSLVSKFATSAAGTLGWGMFVLLVSYFLLSESGQLRENLVHIEIPGYNADIQRLARELGYTWDNFLRGQLILSLLVILSYDILLTILGTRLSLAIAIMAGAARFVPYLGPLVTWTVTAIVAFLQTSNYYDLEPVQYALLVVGLCFLLDQVFDNLVSPRLLGRTLGVHPAGVLIAAIIAANLIGVIGLVLAAPVLATLSLVARYVGRKMFDLAPWPVDAPEPEPIALPWARMGLRFQKLWREIVKRWQKKER
ncbi:MAG: AI-2E family transporter [Anaerolineales bacterium]|nr:AI-2E family transporter [Anaerolineales bacterium]